MLRAIRGRLRFGSALERLVNLSSATLGLPAPGGYCPVCDNRVYRWQAFGREVGGGKKRLEPQRRLCPHCGSFERTRHFLLYLRQTGVLKSLPQFLHFAPEPGLAKYLRSRLGGRYRTTDLFKPDVDLRQDIAAMTLADQSFDYIYCSNVLEHVGNDRAAMRELFRVLRPGGVALIQVPIAGEATYENPLITDPVERTKHFGQADHLRSFGRDIRHQLAAVGFAVEELQMPDCLCLSPEETLWMNLSKRELVHRCVKPG